MAIYCKKQIICVIIMFFIVLSRIYGEETRIINNIFFNDFEKIQKKIYENMSESVLMLSFISASTFILIKNDEYLKEKVQKTKNDFNDKFFEYINYGGEGIHVLAFNSFLFLFSEREKKTAYDLLECISVNGIVTYFLKFLFARKRPSQTENPSEFKFFNFSDSSMPSGHTVVAFTWAEVLNKNYGIWYISYPLATLVAYSRVYKNAHWVSDVFVGAFLGLTLTKIIIDDKNQMDLTINFNNINLSYRF